MRTHRGGLRGLDADSSRAMPSRQQPSPRPARLLHAHLRDRAPRSAQRKPRNHASALRVQIRSSSAASRFRRVRPRGSIARWAMKPHRSSCAERSEQTRVQDSPRATHARSSFVRRCESLAELEIAPRSSRGAHLHRLRVDRLQGAAPRSVCARCREVRDMPRARHARRADP